VVFPNQSSAKPRVRRNMVRDSAKKKNRLHIQMLEYREKMRISRKSVRELATYCLFMFCPVNVFTRRRSSRYKKLLYGFLHDRNTGLSKLSALYRCLSSIRLQITVTRYTRSLPVSFTALSTVSFYNILCSFFVNS